MKRMAHILTLCWMATLLLSTVQAQRNATWQLTTDDGLPSNTVRNIVQDSLGFLWLGTDAGLCRYDGTEVRVFPIPENGSDQYVSALQLQGDSLLTGTEKGAFCLLLREERFVRLDSITLQPTGREAQLKTSDGRLWIGTWNDGLMLMGSDGQRRQVLSPTLTGLGTHIHTLFEYDAQTLLIGCDEGLVAYDTRLGTTTLWDAPKFVYAITADHEGGLWVGTFYNGVSYLSPLGKRIEGVAGHVVSGFCQDSQGRIWTTSDEVGLRCLDGPYAQEAVLGKVNAHALLLAADRLWVGTYSAGVYAMELATGALHHYTTADGLYDNSSYAMHTDGQQRLWVATMQGLCRQDGDRFTAIRKLDAVAVSMASDRKGQLWIATQGAGVYRFDGRQWQQYRASADTASLSNDQTNCVVVDRNGTVWVATESGLCRYDEQANCFRRIQQVDGVFMSSIVEQDENLWLATANGVLRYTPGSGEVVCFTREDGLVGVQFQPNACFRDAQGYIYFGTTNGYSRFLPQMRTNEVVPRVVITRLEVLNASVAAGTELLPVPIQFTRQIDLHHADRMFTLSFASLSYCTPSKNQYAYRLDGYDDEWHYVGHTHQATYASLPAGTYLFRVRATNNDGLWSAHEAQLRIVVHPPLWWTWWARIAYLLIAAVLVFGLITWRRRRSAVPAPDAQPTQPQPDIPAETEATTTADDEFLQRLNQLIEQRLSSPDLNVSLLATELGVSRSSLFAKVKALTNATPNELIQLVRLRRAAQLLSDGTRQVSEVCYTVGFSNPSYFAKCFQKQYGVRPADYHKQAVAVSAKSTNK